MPSGVRLAKGRGRKYGHCTSCETDVGVVPNHGRSGTVWVLQSHQTAEGAKCLGSRLSVTVIAESPDPIIV